MRIVATGAVRRREGLIVMRFLQGRILDVVTIDADSGSALGQMKIKLGLAGFSRLMGCVAGVASHVEGGMAAALFGDVQSLSMAIQAEILSFISRFSFQQLVLVVAGVRIVALDAVANGWWMHRPF